MAPLDLAGKQPGCRFATRLHVDSDALNSSRYYRDALPKEKVVEHLEKGIGTHFDPAMTAIFLEMIREDPAGLA